MFTLHNRLVPFALALGLCVTTSAAAQTADADSPAEREATAQGLSAPQLRVWPRSYVVGRGGLTFATRTAPLLGGEFGGHIAPMLQLYGSFDWHRDISPSFIEDLGEIISDIASADVNYRLPTLTAIAGMRVIAPRGSVRPYGVGGFGYGRVRGTVEIEGEDVTGLLDQLGYLDRDDIEFNKLLFEVGGGIAASQGRLMVDVSYRFRKFLQTGEPINMSGLYVGATQN